MEIVVGVNESRQSHDALALGAALASSLGADLVVATIYPVAYQYSSPARVDAEWTAFLLEQANETLTWARKIVGDREGVTYLKHGHRSSGVGLIEIATQRKASAIVFGSAPNGADGRISSGSTADQLFHGSPVVAVIAPHGYREWAPETVTRVVVAYQQTQESEYALTIAKRGLAQVGFRKPPVTLLTVIERVTKMYSTRLGPHAEDQVLATLREQAIGCQAKAVKELTDAGYQASAEIVEGGTVTNALSNFDWDDGDLLVVGSATAGAIRRVLLGDMTFKILRAATVPVAVVPRSPR